MAEKGEHDLKDFVKKDQDNKGKSLKSSKTYAKGKKGVKQAVKETPEPSGSKSDKMQTSEPSSSEHPLFMWDTDIDLKCNNETDTISKADVSVMIKEALAQVMPAVITEIKDKYQQDIRMIEDSENSSNSESEEEEIEEGEITEQGLEHLMTLSGRAKTDTPKINENLAKGCEDMMSKGIQPEIKEKLIKKYNTPPNCLRMDVLKCNPEIYKTASKQARVNESQLKNIQETLSKGINALTNSFDKNIPLANGSEKPTLENMQEINNINADALALFSQSSYMLDMYRKNNFQREFKYEYKSICKDEEIKGQLFGKDLGEKVKAMTEVNSISNKLSKKHYSSNRKRKYDNNQDKSSKTFLDKSHQREKGNKQPKWKSYTYRKKNTMKSQKKSTKQ